VLTHAQKAVESALRGFTRGLRRRKQGVNKGKGAGRGAKARVEGSPNTRTVAIPALGYSLYVYDVGPCQPLLGEQLTRIKSSKTPFLKRVCCSFGFRGRNTTSIIRKATTTTSFAATMMM
jgi:hypothetical protein